MDYFKLIDAYLNGDLTGSELSDFLKEVKNNTTLAKEIKLYKKADEIKKREDLEKLHAEFMKSRKKKENNPL